MKQDSKINKWTDLNVKATNPRNNGVEIQVS